MDWNFERELAKIDSEIGKIKPLPEKRADAVFEGGGVKGIGLAGALYTAEKLGIKWQNVAGTSAGSIVASLVAAGYSANEILRILQGQDLEKFKDKGPEDKMPLVGMAFSVLSQLGIYEGNYIENWIRTLLAKRGKSLFKDLLYEGPDAADERYRYTLRVVTAEVTGGELVVLPQDIARYEKDPDDFSIARAVRMSTSIPGFFEPVKLGKRIFVDGGMLSNFPVWLFDSDGVPEWPTFGFRLVDDKAIRDGQVRKRPRKIKGPTDYIVALVSTMMEAHDRYYIRTRNYVRTILIPTLGIRATDYDMKKERQLKLFLSGARAAVKFFGQWDFEEYKKLYR
jgi:NTE family protein